MASLLVEQLKEEKLTSLSQNNLAEALTEFVDKEEKEAISEWVRGGRGWEEGGLREVGGGLREGGWEGGGEEVRGRRREAGREGEREGR